MTHFNDELRRTRARASGLIARNARSLGAGPFEGRDAGAGAQDGALQLALSDGEIAALRLPLRLSGADKRLDRTIERMTGGRFTPGELRRLEERALKAAEWEDVRALTGIEEGPPVMLSPRQKAVIDRLMGELGSDALSDRARAAYTGAQRAGQVRVR